MAVPQASSSCAGTCWERREQPSKCGQVYICVCVLLSSSVRLVSVAHSGNYKSCTYVTRVVLYNRIYANKHILHAPTERRAKASHHIRIFNNMKVSLYIVCSSFFFSSFVFLSSRPRHLYLWISTNARFEWLCWLGIVQAYPHRTYTHTIIARWYCRRRHICVYYYRRMACRFPSHHLRTKTEEIERWIWILPLHRGGGRHNISFSQRRNVIRNDVDEEDGEVQKNEPDVTMNMK